MSWYTRPAPVGGKEGGSSSEGRLCLASTTASVACFLAPHPRPRPHHPSPRPCCPCSASAHLLLPPRPVPAAASLRVPTTLSPSPFCCPCSTPPCCSCSPAPQQRRIFSAEWRPVSCASTFALSAALCAEPSGILQPQGKQQRPQRRPAGVTHRRRHRDRPRGRHKRSRHRCRPRSTDADTGADNTLLQLCCRHTATSTSTFLPKIPGPPMMMQHALAHIPFKSLPPARLHVHCVVTLL